MAHWISEAVESVLTQTYDSYEIIVVDDGSDDDTCTLLGQYAPHITYVYQQNAGINAARTRGLNQAKGEYITLLDADDRWLPDKLEEQINFMRTCPHLDLIFTDFYNFDDTGVTKRTFLDNNEPFKQISTESISNEHPNWKICEQNLLYHYLRGNFILPSTLMIKKDTCEKFNIWESDFMPRETYEFFVRSLHQLNVAVIDKALVHRRIHRTSLTFLNAERFHQKTITICKNAQSYPWIDDSSRLFLREQLVTSHFLLGKYYLSKGKVLQARKLLKYAYSESRQLHQLAPLLSTYILTPKLILVLKRIKHAFPRM
jgi:glycosyltransferase involved in cell wall biosynthesis